MEQITKESIDILKNIFEYSPIAIGISDADGKIINANRTLLEMFGISKLEDIYGNNIFLEPNVPQDKKDDLKCGKTIRFELEYNFNLAKETDLYKLNTTKSGISIIDCLFTPLLNEKCEISGFMGHFQDITKKRTTEKALNYSERRYRSILNSLDAKILTTNKEYQVTGAYGKGFEKNKVDKSSYLGKTASEILGEQGKLHEEMNDRAFLGESVTFDWETVRDNKKVYTQTSLTPILNDNNEVEEILGIGVDVTKSIELSVKYKSLVEGTLVGVCLYQNKKIVYANKRLLKIFGYSMEEIMDKSITDLIYADDKPLVISAFSKLKINANEVTSEFRIVSKNGSIANIQMQAILTSLNGELAIMGTVLDITERKIHEKESLEAKEKLDKNYKELKLVRDELQLIFDNVNAVIWSADLEQKTVRVSKGITKLLGFSEEELEKNPDLYKEFIHPDDKEAYNHIRKKMFSKKAGIIRQYRFINRNGDIIWVEESLAPLFNSKGNIFKINGVITDITNRKEMEHTIEHMAYHDSLTGLPNRYMLNQYVAKALARSKRSKGQLAIMFLDLDNFKAVNDTMGHETGDFLLRQVSELLKRTVREGDTVSRQGGDEFIILLEDVDQKEAVTIAKRILDEFCTPFQLHNKEFFISPSIGISLYPKHGEDEQTLIKHADDAMYLAKKFGKNNYKLFTPKSENMNSRMIELEQGLRKAIENNELVLYYQPQVELDTENIIGVEALLRWFHPELGLVLPSEFIPIAEETGLIVPIGDWVLETACWQNKKWQDADLSPIKIAVNISVRQMQDIHFVQRVKKVLQKTGLSPEYLELEVTESLMQNFEQSLKIISELKDLGVKISIDDFGTGYSSLSILNKLPIDCVKIDRSFIKDVLSNSNTAAIVRTIINMCQNLNFDLIAEGVENKEQADFLKEHQCRVGQGYLYSVPAANDDIEKLFRKYTFISL